MSRRPKAPKYSSRLVEIPGRSPFLVRVRVSDCHPEVRHHAGGICVECYARNKAARDAAIASKALRQRLPSHWRPLVAETLARGQRWREHWPGAAYQMRSDVPPTCPRERCGGALQETVAGASCVSCGASFHVAEALLAALVRGRDPSLMRSVESL